MSLGTSLTDHQCKWCSYLSHAIVRQTLFQCQQMQRLFFADHQCKGTSPAHHIDILEVDILEELFTGAPQALKVIANVFIRDKRLIKTVLCLVTFINYFIFGSTHPVCVLF